MQSTKLLALRLCKQMRCHPALQLVQVLLKLLVIHGSSLEQTTELRNPLPVIEKDHQHADWLVEWWRFG